MLDKSAAYRAAIVGSPRRIEIQAVVDISDPDMTFSGAESSGAANFSQSAQLYDRVMDLTPYATLEPHRWVLNGKFRLIPSDGTADQVGFVGDVLSGEDGSFSPAVWVEERFSNASILQACSVYFPGDDWDGVPDTFAVEIRQGGTAYYTKEFAGNRARSVSLSGFTVNNPDAIRVTVSKWSLPGRRMRVAEILPGLYEQWDAHILAAFSCAQQGDFSCLSLPYGTLELSIDNHDRRFEPRNKGGLFLSLEERQGIDALIGVRLADGSVERCKIGRFYQAADGWKTGDNGLTIRWSLVDIVGLLTGRTFLVPDKLPTTLGGWVGAITAQQGHNFVGRYHVDPAYTELPVTANSVAEVTDKSCGDILRWACMATGTWPRAAAGTGDLTVEPLWSQGGKLLLDNLTGYPVMRANKSIAALIFKLADESNTEYVVSGNATSSEETVTISNPFLHTTAQALTAARLILSCYGGNLIETTGRGDPSGEIGDVDTIWLDESRATTARRMMQTFKIQDGALQGCQSRLLQADGSFLFQERAVLTKSGSWTAPAGVTALRLILVGKGEDGTAGTDGTWDEAGADGVDGIGGLVWAGTVSINPQQSFSVQIGDNSVFGQYSSANGSRFPFGYTDIASGDSFARTGVQKPVPGSGDGGAKGLGGIKGNRHREPSYDSEGNPVGSHWEIDNYPGEGTAGQAGVSGCVVIYWDKEGA